jgi:predicted transcriptional regulator of viral defense system
MVNEGTLTPVRRGLYETDSTVPGYYLAGSVYGPSYLSFEFALQYYGLIPEAVYTFTCATYEKKKAKRYTSAFGVFTYRDVPKKAYPLEVELVLKNGYGYQIASPEKAVCDMLYKTSPLKNSNGLQDYLFSDLRIDTDEFAGLDMNKLGELCSMYRTQNHRLMEAYARKVK